MIRPTLRQMEYLIALHEEQSFGKAASRCNVTQSTLSAGIKEFENILEQPLVIRGRKNITLTPLGLETMEEAKTILEKTDHITARAQSAKSPLTGILRLGVIPTIAPYLLPVILPKIRAKYPQLELHLHEETSEQIVQKLNQNTLDFALLAFPYETPNITQLPLFNEPFFLACPKGKEPKTLPLKTKDINMGEILLLEKEHCLTDHALSACNLQQPKLRKTYSATSLQTLIQMVSHGYGMTLLPEMATQPDILPPNISIIPFTSPTPTRSIGLCWRKNSPKQKEYEALADLIQPHE